MTQEEILQYNKRCAEFLGWDYNKFMDRWNEEDFQHEYFNTNSIDLKFDSDWNWIMDVVEAIVMYYKDKEIPQIHLLNQPIFTPKEAVVQAINQFLIWYKQNKTV